MQPRRSTRRSASLPTERFFERHGWKILLLLTVLLFAFGAGDVLAGLQADPALARSVSGMQVEDLRARNREAFELADWSVRSGGIHLMVIGILMSVIVLTGFRRGEKWAWWTMWTLPLWNAFVWALLFVTERASDAPTPPPMISAPIFLALSTLVLIATAYRFLGVRQLSRRGEAVKSGDATPL